MSLHIIPYRIVSSRRGFLRYLSVNSPELIFDLVNAKPGTNHSTNPTNPNGNSKR